MENSHGRWEQLLLRLQSVARRQCRGHGFSLVTVTLAFKNDRLVQWSRPTVKFYEPGGSNELLELLAWDSTQSKQKHIINNE